HLVELVADRLWLVADGKVTPFEGDMAEYRSWLIEQSRSANRSAKQDDTPQQSRKDDRRDRAEARKAQAPLRKIIKDAEAKLTKLAAERATIEAKLADPALYTNGKTEDVTRLNTRMAAIGKTQAELEEAWLEAEAELESAQAADE
ncbi:MAG: ABC transporter ATP-binding protein, partial [Acetobacter cibinongensis]